MANTNIFGAVGFILGPLLQAALVPISFPGPLESKAFHFNMYTAPILLSVLVTFITLMVIVIAFTEHSVTEDIANMARIITPYKDVSVDYIAAVSCILLFFCSYLNFAFLETIIVPLIVHMFAWTKAKATLVQSLGIGGTALLSILVYIVIQWLSKRIRERTLFLLGFIILVVSYLVILPWDHVYPKIQMADIGKTASTFHTTIRPEALPLISLNKTAWATENDADIYITPQETRRISPTLMTVMSGIFQYSETYSADILLRNTTGPLGCPWQYTWCQTVPGLHLIQLVLGLILYGIGYPTTNLLAISIFSKILGPKPMGLWMGILIASGCVAGIVGPILQTILYDNFGPRITFIAVTALMGVTILFILGIFKRLRPFGDNYTHGININKG